MSNYNRKKYYIDPEMHECSRFPKPTIIDLPPYGMTLDEAEQFFNIMKLIPLLEELDLDGHPTRFSLFKLMDTAITQPVDNKIKFLGFATAIGCKKMIDFLMRFYFPKQ
jgi:hypothetical protein